MAPLLSLVSLVFHLLLHLGPTLVSGGNLLFEDGYTVSTILNGDKVKMKPHLILPQSPFSDEFIVLDSAASTFYTVSLPTSQEIVIKRLAGNGQSGYADGDLDSATFNRPKSFAVDYKGNVYVADQNNQAIRKIAKSGVTTIAGGTSQKSGHDTDGPALNASVSKNFELVFVPGRCALMVSDIEFRLIRQINLKAEDCKVHSGSGLGMSAAWLLGVGVSCLLVGLVVGFIVRPYVLPREAPKRHHCSGTWKQYLMSLERQLVIFCSDIRSVVVSSTAYSVCTRLPRLSLSTLALIFRFRIVEPQLSCKKPVSLMDCDVLYNHQLDQPQRVVADQLSDLISFEGGLPLTEQGMETNEQEATENAEISYGKESKINGMIQANIACFAEKSPMASLELPSDCSRGLVKRRLNASTGYF